MATAATEIAEPIIPKIAVSPVAKITFKTKPAE